MATQLQMECCLCSSNFDPTKGKTHQKKLSLELQNKLANRVSPNLFSRPSVKRKGSLARENTLYPPGLCMGNTEEFDSVLNKKCASRVGSPPQILSNPHLIPSQEYHLVGI